MVKKSKESRVIISLRVKDEDKNKNEINIIVIGVLISMHNAGKAPLLK
jgi:hypothetical protein